MIEQWISASKALVVAKDAAEIRARAFKGVIRTRAKKVAEADEVQLNVSVPKVMWWPAHSDALVEDWNSGTFATTIEAGKQLVAYQVSFDLSDILDILPLGERATAARRASVAGDPNWVPAADVIAPWKSAGLDDEMAKAKLVGEARLGFLSATAVLAEFENGPVREIWEEKEQWAEREWPVEPWFWERFAGVSPRADWSAGSFLISGSMPIGHGTLKLSGVHFQRRELSALLEAIHASPQGAHAKNKGGRPPLPFTDDLWAALCARLYLQDVDPFDRKTIAKIILDWGAERGHDLSPKTADNKAGRVIQSVRELEQRLQKKPRN